MMRSMFAGVSGLRSHQAMMDVVGNNIANVNTTGFKAAQVTFAEAISQTLSGASGSTDTRAGINPTQIGLGVNLGGVDRVFTQGASQVTGRTTDLAIQGDGFFVMEAGGERTYTRSGVFNFDDAGNLTAAGGRMVQGWMADADGTVDMNRPVSDINLPTGQLVDPEATTLVQIGGNLSADTAVAEQLQSSIVIYDSMGTAHEVEIVFTKAAVNSWTLSASVGGNPLTVADPNVTFDTEGALTSTITTTIGGYAPPGADTLDITLNFNSGANLAQFGGQPSMEARYADGSAIGTLSGYSIGEDGTIEGQFSNGTTVVLARIATAVFANNGGLLQVGDGNFRATAQSGIALVGPPGTASRGLLAPGTLEMSNVDLAKEFTNLIIAQRGFQANSRVITSSDELLADLVNLKR